jgi:hypothetical protein
VTYIFLHTSSIAIVDPQLPTTFVIWSLKTSSHCQCRPQEDRSRRPQTISLGDTLEHTRCSPLGLRSPPVKYPSISGAVHGEMITLPCRRDV